jgi:hypothetical protein
VREPLTPPYALKNRAALSRKGRGHKKRQPSYSGSPCSIMQVRCIASCCVPHVDCDIFPALALQSRSAFSRAALICGPPSLRCAGLPGPKPQVPVRALQPRAYSYVPLPISFQLAPRAEITRAGENRKRRRSAYLQACLPQRGGTATKSSHNDVGTNCRLAPNALFVVAEHAGERERQFVARMSVSEIRGCPACRFAHAGYAILARE